MLKKNVLILGLSIFSTQELYIDGEKKDGLKSSEMTTDDSVGLSLRQDYIYQLEPVPVMLYEKLGKKKIDLVIEIGTAQTDQKREIYLEDGTLINSSPREFFEERLRDKVVKFYPVEIDGKEDVMPQKIMEIVRELRKTKEEGEYDLWIDNHGGLRNSQMVLQCILSLLKKDGIQPKETYMLEYSNGAGVVKVAKQANSINEFVSGVNEFLNFGRSQSIQKYFELNGEKNDLPQKIQNIADAIQLCNVKEFESALDEMQTWILNNNQSYKEKYQELFVEYLQSDYGDLLSKEKRTTLKEIAWCMEKDFIQQALTLIESKMPDDIMEYGYLLFDKNMNVSSSGKNNVELIKIIKQNKKWWENPTNYMLQQFCYTNVLDSQQKKGKKPKYQQQDLKKIDEINVDTKKRNPVELLYNDQNIQVEVKLPEDQARLETLYKLLKIHMALKNQRNLINHANGKDPNRVSVCVLEKAIKKYMELAGELGIH